jgi:hypothetical protein
VDQAALAQPILPAPLASGAAGAPLPAAVNGAEALITMARNASSPVEHFGLAGDRTVMMGSQVRF